MPRIARRDVLMVLGFALLMGFLAVLPYIEHTFSPLYQGLTIARDKDYANYESRLERALKGHPEEADNAITPLRSGIEGVQTAGMENMIAFLFGWTGLEAPKLAVVVTGLAMTLSFCLFFVLFSLLEFAPRPALGMTLILFLVLFDNFGRVMHPGWSFVPTVLALLTFFLFTKHPTWMRAMVAGALLGILPSLYFWSWCYVWAGAACMILFSRPPRKMVILLAAVTLLVAAPFFLHTFLLSRAPFYDEVMVRASFLMQRTPESWPRSLLLLTQTVLFLSLWKRYGQMRSYRACAALLLGILIAMHQNVIHGKVLMFSSHFYPHLLVSTVVAGAFVLVHRAPLARRVLIAGIAAVFLIAGLRDYFPAHRFLIPQPVDFADQHLAPAIRLLQKYPRMVVLTDAQTGRLVTSWTDDGIVYTTHARFLLISDAELAERYCVSAMFHPKPLPARVLSLEYNRVLQSSAYQQYEQKLLSEACARVKKDPRAYLSKYGVNFILWNHTEAPTWRIDENAFHLAPLGIGSGWTLWTVPR